MKKIFLLFVSVLATTICNAQTVKGNFEAVQMFVVGNNLIVSGYVMKGNKATFKAILYNEELKVLKEYAKEIQDDVEKAYPSANIQRGIMTVGIRTKSKNSYFSIKLTDDLKEISSGEITMAAPVNASVADKNHKLDRGQLGMEGANFSSLVGNRKTSIINDRYLNTDIIDFDRKSGIITRNKLNESEIDYSEVWQTKLDNGDKIKLTGFSYVDEDDIIGCFIVKEKKKWNDYICRLDSKTGKVQFMVPIKYSGKNEEFFLCNSYFDKQKNNLIVAGRVCSLKGKQRCNSMVIFLFDKNGILIKTQKNNFPDYPEEPSGFNFKEKNINIERIEKLPNGNYFFHNTNTSTGLIVGFSYFELDDKLNVINSNFKIEENFDKKPLVDKDDWNNPSIAYSWSSNDGRYIFLTETYRRVAPPPIQMKSKSLKMIDVASRAGKTTELKYIDYFTPGKDVFGVYFLDNSVIMFQQTRNSKEYEITAVPIR